jgi:hypothetical protein
MRFQATRQRPARHWNNSLVIKPSDRAVEDLRSDASRAIDLAWKRYHNGIGSFHPER